MSSSVPPSAGGVLVITPADSQQVNVMQTFGRASPLALGVVQIMIGVMVLLFGIPMATGAFPLLVVYSGTFVWGALLYIIAGSLTVAAGKFINRSMLPTVFVNPGSASMAAQAPPTSYAPPAPSAQPATLQMQREEERSD
ncbi:uncharacterized protein LKV04_002159 [Tautogolabrus adspersus]